MEMDSLGVQCGVCMDFTISHRLLRGHYWESPGQMEPKSHPGGLFTFKSEPLAPDFGNPGLIHGGKRVFVHSSTNVL